MSLLANQESGHTGEERSKQYHSRLQRARTANLERRTSLGRQNSVGQLDTLSQVRDSGQGGPPPAVRIPTSDTSDGAPTPTRPAPTPAAEEGSTARPTLLFEAHDKRIGARWAWSEARRLVAVVDLEQEMRLLSENGEVRYRVQLPKEGSTIFLGWEQSGSVLAAVQRLGGAFLWFPTKPEAVQQWEGMQFSSKLLKSSVLKRNAHFDASFAAWSPKGKLVLGLADGNFAVWDLASNETFMSRKHFAGRHHSSISCGAWGPYGDNLALASLGQLKVSQPLVNASWEHTAAKLSLPDEEIAFQELCFSGSGEMLAAFAGSSIFRHLCLYQVQPAGKNSTKLVPVGEAHPTAEVGGLQAMLWLENDIMAVVTSNGFVRLLKYDRQEGAVMEACHRPSTAGVTDAVLLDTGHIAIVSLDQITYFNPLLTTDPIKKKIWELPHGARPGKIQAAKKFLLVATTDGALHRVKLPELQQLDLSLLTVAGSEDDLVDSARTPRPASGKGAFDASSRSPTLLGEVRPEDGATRSSMLGMHFAYSSQVGCLAVINGSAELVVFKRDPSNGRFELTLKSPIPEAQCVFLDWDPTTEMHLAFALRGTGVGLWQAGGDADINMWSGMSYKNNIFSLSKDTKTFDPLYASWSKAGQLALGLADGNFAVWDSVSTAVSVSQKTGRHKTGITTGAWLSSLFAPALALASTSTIKVSQGFDSAEWSATAMKLKLPGRAPSISRAPSLSKLRNRGAGPDPEGLHFFSLAFSPSGRFLAAIAAPTSALEQKQSIIYELQDQREALVAVYEGEPSEDDGQPFMIGWVGDTLLICHKTHHGGSVKLVVPAKFRGVKQTWPSSSQATPGRLVDAALLGSGLLAVAFELQQGGGVVMLLGCPKMTVLAEMPCERVPHAVKLYGPALDGSAILGISFATGGVEIWQV